ncbi:endosome-associated-trafficking regulator 1 isoform X8 [Anarhichas minor]|uniref:endosome-associated-trafficking regulator 1 isoform X8 n=1 Tax=Anarhichas minor TaxID=65739 RepID=UPI003F73BABB
MLQLWERRTSEQSLSWENGSNKDQNQKGTEEGRGDKLDGQEGTSGAQEARVEETGVTQELRVEETGGAQEVRGEETSGVQEVREERTSGGQEVIKDGASEVQKVRESTGGQVETGREVDMEADEEQRKAPQLKRKQRGDSGSSQAKKVATKESAGAAECESSQEEGAAADSEPSEYRDGSCRSSGDYSVEKIKEFLKRSKNVRGAKVEDYLSDKEKLSSSARAHMRSKDRGGLTKQEGFRLKKIVHKDGAKGRWTLRSGLVSSLNRLWLHRKRRRRGVGGASSQA